MTVRKAILLFIIAVATGCVWLVGSSASRKITVRTYFHHAQGLIPGARVQVDGVEAGFVREVTLETKRGNRPIAVRMALDTANGSSVPSDATASLQVDEVLGPTFVEVDTRNRTGAPISNNGILESVEAVDNTGAAQALEVIGNKLLDESKKLREKENSKSEWSKSKQ